MEERPTEDNGALAVETHTQKRAQMQKGTIISQEKTLKDAVRSQENPQRSSPRPRKRVEIKSARHREV